MNSLIKILDSISGYLKSKRESNKTRKFFIIFIIFLSVCLSLINISIIYGTVYNLYFPDISIKIYTAVLILTLSLIFFIYNAYRILKNQNKTKIIFFTNIFPMFIGILFLTLSLTEEYFDSNFDMYYNIILYGALSIYPLFDTLQSIFKKLNCNLLNKIKIFFFVYSLGFFFFLSLNAFFATIGVEVFKFGLLGEITFELIESAREVSYLDFIEKLSLIFLFIAFTLSPIYLLNIHFDEFNHNKKKLFSSIILLLFIVLFQYTDPILYKFSSYLVDKSSQIIFQNGDNYESYKKAKGFFTEKAYLVLAKRGNSYNNYIFKKLYDSTFEEYFGKKIADQSMNSRSFATNLSKVGDKAEVVLSLGEIENKIISENVFTNLGSGVVDILETTYRFHYTNESNINQEIIMFFETPSKYSVITDLKLGLDGEMIGQIAPRGAAKQVYENSLVRNIDPALIEKIGLNTYSLRVFPIPSKTDKKTNGRQLVEIKVSSPIEGDKIYYSPKFTFANLKTDKDSSFISKVYKNDNLIKEDTKKGKNVNLYLNSNHFISLNEAQIENKIDFGEICLNTYLQNLLETNKLTVIDNKKSLDNKFILFFDNSESVIRNKANNLYAEIFNGFKNYSGVLNDLDLYSYNFEVQKLSDINDIKFRGYNDIDRSIDYIINNDIENKNIIFITDDSNFNLSTVENKNRNLQKLISNKISIIKIGEKIKSYKSDFNSIVSASDGNIYNLNNSAEIQEIIGLIKKEDKIIINSKCISSSDNNNINKIQAGYISNNILKNVKGEDDWYKIAELQNKIANNYKIVNQFNSIIALETQNQQIELDKYSQLENKFDSNYENYGKISDENFSTNVDNRTSDFMKTESTSNSSSFSDSKNLESGTNKVNIEAPFYGYTYINYNTEINMFIIIKILIYLMEFIGIFTFIIKLTKKQKFENLSNSKKV